MSATAPVIPVFDTPKTAHVESLRSHYTPEQKSEIKAKIKQKLKEQDAVLVAHYYVDAELQELAEETGGYVSDSLEVKPPRFSIRKNVYSCRRWKRNVPWI